MNEERCTARYNGRQCGGKFVLGQAYKHSSPYYSENARGCFSPNEAVLKNVRKCSRCGHSIDINPYKD